jgi:CBS domain-containing protein
VKLRALVGGHVETVDSQATLRAAARHMVGSEIGSLLVEDEGGIRGIITERDLAQAMAHDADPDRDLVDGWMSDYPHLARADWDLEPAIDVMLDFGFRHLPVMDEGEPVGIVSMRDIVWAIRSIESLAEKRR